MSLKEYQEKRNFAKTPEPKGKVGRKTSAIFTIQKHAASHLHYDFRLAIDGVLKSWAIPKGPCLDPSVKRLAIEVEDHPLSYAQFEGNIPEGQYGAGTVIVWDYGMWESEQDLSKAYYEGNMHFTLKGSKLSGAWKLIRTANAKKAQWLLVKVKDAASRKLSEEDITLNGHSVLTGKTLEEMAKKKDFSGSEKQLPQNFKPELATLAKEPPKGVGWVNEIKYDGYRIIAFIENNQVRLISRNNQDWTKRFTSIAKSLSSLGLNDTLLDGEVVALDEDGHSNFQLLQNSLKDNDAQNLHYFVFDIPIYHGQDLTKKPLVERKKILKSIFKKNHKQIHYSDHIEGNSEAAFKQACEKGLEGIIAKKANATYQQTRTDDWLKIKCIQRQEFLIAGYTKPKGGRKHFGSLLLGYYDKGHLFYCGHVGTGFTQKSLAELYKELVSLEQPRSAFDKEPPMAIKKNAIWVKPKLIAEVEFSEWTNDGYLRHPSFKGLREDKSSKEIGREFTQETNLSISHPNKIIYSKASITKADLAKYYLTVSARLLPHIRNRPLTLVRCPNGENRQCFYQKHWVEGLPDTILATSVKERSRSENVSYIMINDQDGLLAAAQLAVLELHPWSSCSKNLLKPNRLIFDLDPSLEVKWKDLISATVLLRDSLHSLGLISFVKLTGGKGIHIVVPIRANQDHEKMKSFSKMLAEVLSKNFPQIFTANLSKRNRVGKIFIDYLRNEYAATAVAPFSPRANAEASIAVPISWDYLNILKKPFKYTIQTWSDYIKDFPSDPWEDFFAVRQSITQQHFEALTLLKS